MKNKAGGGIRKALVLLLGVMVSQAVFTGCEKKEAEVHTVVNLPPVYTENNYVVGASAHNLLSSIKYSTLKVEIQYMRGFVPDIISVNNLIEYLNSLAHKPTGIYFTLKEINPSLKTSLYLTEIATIENKNREFYTYGNQICVYILYTDGISAEGANLGLSYRNTSMVIFGKTLDDYSGGVGQPSRTKLETNILEHEFGHLLGLVNMGSPMLTNHLDPAHATHCINPYCLMYYRSASTSIMTFLVEGEVPLLDAYCMADLRANGGK